MVETARQSCGGQSQAIDRRRHSGNSDRDVITLHEMPRRSFSFLPQRRQANGTSVIYHRLDSMKRPRATLDRVLSKAGIASRTTTREWIEQGRVKVNGRIVRNPDHWVESGKDVVHFDGMPLRREKKVYIAFNKPAGVITSREDKKNRPTVYDYLQDFGRWVFPVGRLDMDTSGLLILTNDTDFGDQLLSPDSKVPKTYYVKTSGVVAFETYFELAYGLDIGRGEHSGPAIVREVRHTEKNTWLELTITEGKNRQV